MTHHDLIIVGSGSGNSIADDAFSHKSVAIVDGGIFGGTCLNVGCIPTKMFVYPADVIAQVRDEAAVLGLTDAVPPRADWGAIRDRIFGRIDAISEAGLEWRRDGAPNTTAYTQRARLTGPRALRLEDGRELTCDELVLAAGSRPVLPSDIQGLRQEDVDDPLIPVHTSDTIMRIDAPPQRLLVIGSGFIAAEFSHVFSSYGVEVTQVARSAALLRSFDDDVSHAFTARAAQHWQVHTESVPTALRATCSGVELDVRASDGSGSTLEADMVLVATGRRPNSDLLGLAEAGYDLAEDGRLAVDEYQRALSGGRPVPGVYGLGDLSSADQLKHVANHEAKVVRHNLLNPGQLWKSNHRPVPSVVFSHPQVATVGLTEAQARATDRSVVTAVHPYADVAYGWAMAEEADSGGFVKLIADRDTGDLLGAHILGAAASLLLQPLVQAMSFGLPARTMARGQYWPHPALSEVVENALLKLPLSDAAK